MSKDNQSISVKDLMGKQVIDNKGTLLGVLKDLRLTCGGQDTEAIIELKTGEKTKVPWSDIQSVEDFVLLKSSEKVMEERKPEIMEEPVTEISEPVPAEVKEINCANCGAKIPSRAKFCRQCGKKTE